MPTLQLIYYGAPGTGKSYAVDKKLKELKIEENQIFRVTFHPEYTYSISQGNYCQLLKMMKLPMIINAVFLLMRLDKLIMICLNRYF